MTRETTGDTVDWEILGDMLALTVAAVLLYLAFVMKVALDVSSSPAVAVTILVVFLVAFSLLVEAVSDLEVFDRGQTYAAVLTVVLLGSVVTIRASGGLYTLASYGVLSAAVLLLLSGAWRER
ncbi:hypothetical protein [Natrinema versiforme]|uniref:Uncharacterized protein n=1 Tax=Natrinema versiforme JCM 10478 TaxID=1227496 RepID=L9Y2H6_9EURY|nr:hypothetical protein [Natrinema versiforme]ELY67053.1 hypothetical protein C489_11335 [Natrinema versiforme JCM 10478]